MVVQIEFQPLSNTSRWALEYGDDSMRLSRKLVFDKRPQELLANRIVLAGIVFGDASGEVGTSIPLTFDFCEHLARNGVMVRARNRSVEQGHGITATKMMVRHDVLVDPEFPARDETVLYLPRSDRFQGNLQGVKEVVVPTNGFIFEGKAAIRAAVASGILFAADLYAREIAIEGIDEGTVASLNNLLAYEDLKVVSV